MRLLSILLGLTLLAACEQGNEPPPEPTPAASSGTESSGTESSVAVPDGWRQETYRGVEISVPATWGWGNGSQRIGQWCVDRGTEREPIVGRPGPTTMVGCIAKEASAGPPETLMANTGVLVAFEDIRTDDDPTRLPRGGDRLVRDLNGVRVIIQAPEDIRDQIASSVRTVDIDANGCGVDDPIAHDASIRPAPAVAVQDVEGVTSAIACRYVLDEASSPTTTPPLLSSRALDPKTAAAVVRGIVGAPEGGGPNEPDSCAAEVAYGAEVMVLRIAAESGDSVVYVRYDGCDHHGFDDGVRVRQVTRDPMSPLIVDANMLFSFSGVMAPVLMSEELGGGLLNPN